MMIQRGLVYTVILTAMCTMNITLAGLNTEGTVVVSDTSFEGIFGGVRNSTSDVEVLFCRDDGSSVLCGAIDNAGNTKTCVTSDPNYMNIVRGMSDSARVHVEFDDAGTCTSMWQANSSSYQPKQNLLTIDPAR